MAYHQLTKETLLTLRGVHDSLTWVVTGEVEEVQTNPITRDRDALQRDLCLTSNINLAKRFTNCEGRRDLATYPLFVCMAALADIHAL